MANQSVHIERLSLRDEHVEGRLKVVVARSEEAQILAAITKAHCYQLLNLF